MSTRTFSNRRRTALTPLLVALTAATALLATPAAADTADSTAFTQVLGHYETVRLALIQDTTDGVAAASREIEKRLDALSSGWSAAAAGVRPADADGVRALLPLLREAAADLSRAGSLSEARDAFYKLSKPLVRWRKAAEGDKPLVAYCSMTRRSWLQPDDGDGLTNPYHGQSMLRCGEVVDG